MGSKPAMHVRRHHTHLLLPQAALGEPQRVLLDEALKPAGWTSEPSDSPSMSLQWRRGRDGLRVQTLGWFPLLLTVGPLGRVAKTHRDAVARLTAAVTANGGRTFTDRQLADYLPQAQLRWQRALTERRRLAEAERVLEGRQCRRCGVWSEPSSTHCTGCRLRFTDADDADWKAVVAQASTIMDAAEAVLSDLARGVRLERIAHDATSGSVRHG
ncbi:hypothetical protein AB0I34_30000 [Kribbella sp. NPDC050281]|uniref:hypothetical protein n=1 Tax=Kribbella sp. NPDC050281 TaxID=3155515 RepID=UPI0033CD55D5